MATNAKKWRAQRECEDLASRLGVTIQADQIGSIQDVRVCAPFGEIWTDGGVHELVVSGRGWGSMEWLYETLKPRLEMGLEPCPAGDTCEWCHPDA